MQWVMALAGWTHAISLPAFVTQGYTFLETGSRENQSDSDFGKLTNFFQ